MTNGWKDLAGTVKSYFRLGFAGVRLKSNSGVLEIRNAGDTADANLKAAALQLAGISNVATSITNAQADATTALENAATALAASAVADKTIERFADSAIVSGGTPTIVESVNYRYNFVRYTTVINAQFEWYFVADLSLGASITVLYVSGTGSGVVDLSINGTNVASKDFSTGGANNHALWTATLSASVHGVGRHTLRLKCGGAGSVGAAFAMSVTKVWINAT